jgi:hypothetical protein
MVAGFSDRNSHADEVPNCFASQKGSLGHAVDAVRYAYEKNE